MKPVIDIGLIICGIPDFMIRRIQNCCVSRIFHDLTLYTEKCRRRCDDQQIKVKTFRYIIFKILGMNSLIADEVNLIHGQHILSKCSV